MPKAYSDKKMLERELEEYRQGYYALLKCRFAVEAVMAYIPHQWPDECYDDEVKVSMSSGCIEAVEEAVEAIRVLRSKQKANFKAMRAEKKRGKK